MTRGAKFWNSGAVPLIPPERLAEIIATAADIAIVIDDVGKILSVMVNPTHGSFGRVEHWEGRDIRDVLTVESVPKLETRLEALTAGESPERPVELNHSDGINWDFPVRYSFHRIGPDGTLLMLGRDLRQIAEMQQQLVKAQLALERDYEAQREYDTRYRVLMDATTDAILFVAMSSGRIADVNGAAAQLLGAPRDELIGSPLADLFEGRGKGEPGLSPAQLAEATKPVTATARRSRKRLRLAPTLFRAAGERLVLARLDSVETVEATSDELADNLASLYREGADAIVFTDRQGNVTAANESFLDLAEVAGPAQIRGRSLADFLARGSVDLKVLIDNAARSGQMRLYATRMVGEHGGQLAVEVSAAYLNDRTNPAVAFVIRDASRVEAMRKPGVAVSEDGMKNVMELVGSATLKDIVAETTDVVERMCIETAVELTNNNRVAAAEMLGLSRQSLYVKLRKYGLLSREGD